MEIKEEQLAMEKRQNCYMFRMDNCLTQILKELKRRKNGKYKQTND